MPLKEAQRPLAIIGDPVKFRRGDLVEADEEFFAKYGRNSFKSVTRKMSVEEKRTVRKFTKAKEVAGKSDKVIAPDKTTAMSTKDLKPKPEKKAKAKPKPKAKPKSKKKKSKRRAKG